jgi:hypothetical protein
MTRTPLELRELADGLRWEAATHCLRGRPWLATWRHQVAAQLEERADLLAARTWVPAGERP